MAALAYVSDSRGEANPSSTTIDTAASSLTTGNHVIVFVKWEGGDSASSTATDTAGNTYVALARGYNSTVGGQCFYCLNATGHATNVVTVTFSAGRTYRSIQAVQLSGTASTVTQAKVVGSGASFLDTSTDTLLSCGANSILLAGLHAYNSVTSATFAGEDSFTALTVPSAYLKVAYALDVRGTTTGYATATFSATTSVFLGVQVDSGDPVGGTEAEVSKLTGYAITGPHDDKVSATKLVAYAVIDTSYVPPATSRPQIFVIT